MLKIWGRPNAYNVQKVLWFVDELGIEYEHINIGSIAGELENEAFLAKNPNGRIPVIQDDSLYVWESNTILRYLASTYGNQLFWVEDAAERTLVERWMDWELASMQPDFLALFWAYYRTPENQRDHSKIQYYIKRCDRDLTILNGHLENNPYLAGPTLSMADITVGTSFYRYFNMGIEVPALSNVRSWYRRLCDRPAYQKNIMRPFGELKGRLEF